MPKRDSETVNTGNKKARSRVASLLHNTTVTGGLVIASIAVGWLFYAQAGLLTNRQHSDASSARDEQSLQSDTEPKENLEPSQEEKPVASTPDPAESPTPNPKSPQPPEQAAQPDTKQPHRPGRSCDEQAKNRAKQTHDRSMSVENELHKKKLASISELSKLLSGLGLVKDRTAAENKRHDKAVEAITETYRRTLETFHCKA